ncbi:MAG: hypothetical protein WCH05_04265 [Chlorobiaceae bacterium]
MSRIYEIIISKTACPAAVTDTFYGIAESLDDAICRFTSKFGISITQVINDGSDDINRAEYLGKFNKPGQGAKYGIHKPFVIFVDILKQSF